MTYKVKKTAIYSDGELCTYEFNYADYSDALVNFKEQLDDVFMNCYFARLLTVTLSEGDKIIKQVTCSFINNI